MPDLCLSAEPCSSRILDHGLRTEEAAKAAGVSVRTAYKWLHRFREDGADRLVDRTSRPHHSPHALPETTQALIVAARTEGQTYRRISQTLKVGHSSVARVLVRAGLNRLACLEPAAPIQRYEYDAPGGMLHLDIKKLARRGLGIRPRGIDPHSSLGYLPPVSRLKSLNNLVGLHSRRARLRDGKIHSDNRILL